MFQIGDIWFGKAGTVYEGVKGTIRAITIQKVQVSYDRTVELDGMRLGGEVMGKRAFLERFDNYQQASFFDLIAPIVG